MKKNPSSRKEASQRQRGSSHEHHKDCKGNASSSPSPFPPGGLLKSSLRTRRRGSISLISKFRFPMFSMFSELGWAKLVHGHDQMGDGWMMNIELQPSPLPRSIVCTLSPSSGSPIGGPSGLKHLEALISFCTCRFSGTDLVVDELTLASSLVMVYPKCRSNMIWGNPFSLRVRGFGDLGTCS